METFDWGDCPELAFVKNVALYKTLETKDESRARCFVKFIQKVSEPQNPANDFKWKVPDVPDRAVFWFERVSVRMNPKDPTNTNADVTNLAVYLQGEIAGGMVRGHAQGGPLDRALGRL